MAVGGSAVLCTLLVVGSHLVADYSTPPVGD
jgi:hypothetical protein